MNIKFVHIFPININFYRLYVDIWTASILVFGLFSCLDHLLGSPGDYGWIKETIIDVYVTKDSHRGYPGEVTLAG